MVCVLVGVSLWNGGAFSKGAGGPFGGCPPSMGGSCSLQSRSPHAEVTPQVVPGGKEHPGCLACRLGMASLT